MYLGWFLKVSPLSVGSEWWEALLYGVAVGFSSAGFYDMVKSLRFVVREKNLVLFNNYNML